MTVYSRQWIDEPGKTLYWFPDTSLANWATSRVAATERDAPNAGLYDANLDNEVNEEWYLFEGAAQPSNWNEAIISITLPAATDDSDDTDSSTPESDLAASSQAYGPRRVKTPNMDVEQFDPIRIQTATDRQDGTYPTFGDFGFAVAKPNCSKYRK